MSKSLATIILDVDVEFNENELIMCELNPEKVREVFIELEFKNLARRVLGEEIVVSAAPIMDNNGQMDLFGKQAVAEEIKPTEPEDYKTIASENYSYHLISTPQERKELLALLMKQKKVCFDTETDRLDALHANIVGVAFSYKANEAFYVTIPTDFEEAKKIVEEFRPFFESNSILKIGHNIKYDIKVINRYAVAVKGSLFDTMIAHYLINPDMRHNMDTCLSFI